MQDLLFETRREVQAARPFLKWAGGKSQLLPDIRMRLPDILSRAKGVWNGRYFEPFVGSGAVFFDLRPQLDPQNVTLSDQNRELVLTYLAVRDHLDMLIERLLQHEHEHNGVRGKDRAKRLEYYKQVRALDRAPEWSRDADISAEALIEHAARFIYLNRTCFNGLWRVNKSGFFNVPMGAYRRPTICNEKLLMSASMALQGVNILRRDFRAVAHSAAEGDLVYFDPPYQPLSVTSSFTAYSEGAFLEREHRQLAVVYLYLAARGVHVVLSNSDTAFSREPLGPKHDVGVFAANAIPILAELGLDMSAALLHAAYQNHWNVSEVLATRAINSRASKRGAVSEIIVTVDPAIGPQDQPRQS